ncbi:MAG: CPBP family intramembrane glutamic endopeptidase [Pseudomonadota bacterium]
MSDESSIEEREITEVSLLLLIAAQGIAFTGLGLALWWFSGRAVEDWVSLTPNDFFIGLVTTTGLILLALAGFYFPRISNYLILMQAQSYGWLRKFATWRAIIIISFFAGTWEEALFRGGLQVLLSDYIGVPLAILIASAAFALVHLSKPVIGFIQFLIGCLFGVIYHQTGSLLGVMLAHFLYDIFALWYLLREMSRLEEQGLLDMPE